MLLLSSVPVKAKAISCFRAVPAEHLEVVLVGLGRIEAATLVLASETTCALVQVSALPHHPIKQKIATQLLAELVGLPQRVLLVQALALCLGQVKRRIGVQTPGERVETLLRHLGKNPLLPEQPAAIKSSVARWHTHNTHVQDDGNKKLHFCSIDITPLLATLRVLVVAAARI